MIATTDSKNLYEKLDIANKQLKNAKTKEEQVALSSYISFLYDSIRLVSSDKINPNEKDIYGSLKNLKNIDKKLFYYENGMLRNFVLKKEYHNDFFSNVFKKIDHEIRKLEEDEYSGITTLTESEFYNIFFEFMNKLGLSKYFDKFVKNNRIYTTKVQLKENTLGYMIYNPLTKDSDIFIEELEYDIFSMFTLAHEFGHIYDLNHFDDSIENYNRYLSQSFNKEAISKTFERLFVDYLIENNILVDEAKDQLFDMTNYNYEYVLGAFIITLLPDILLIDGSYLDLSPTKIYKIVERYFTKKNNIRKFINKCENFEIYDTYNYAYGDIYSMFLKKLVKENDYKLDVFDEFFKYRSKIFSEDMLDKYNITPKNYVKLYKKDIESLKK